MSMNELRGQEVDPTDGRTDHDDLDDRDIRALTEVMTVLPDVDEARDAPGLYAVVGENMNGTYIVDTHLNACTCSDHEYRDVRCKHRRRVAFATGERAIPAWVDRDAVDDLGYHVDASPQFAAADGGSGIIEAGDEGEILEGDDQDEDQDHDDVDGRPDDCCCGGWNDGVALPCWPCYRDGFGAPAVEEGDN
jgi:hypothetical protein